MTVTDICNLALSYIGKGSIADLEQDTENARVCKRHYDNRRRQLLRLYSWGFAQGTTKLALLDRKFPGWDYAYAYPLKCMAVRVIYNEGTEKIKEWEHSKYKIFMADEDVRVICCNVKEAYMDYTYDNNQTEVYPPDFIEALARGLASDIAMSLTGSSAIAQEQLQYMQFALSTATLTAAQERQNIEHYAHNYALARN